MKLMAMRAYSTLIGTRSLSDLIQSKTPMTIIDASYNIPGSTGNPKTEYFKTRIPGAKFFEIDEIADKSSGYPHMMPPDALFISFMKRLRVKNDNNLLVCYDRLGMFSSPRVWYTFKIFGKKNVAVLDGGLPKWIADGYPLENGSCDLYMPERGEDDKNYDFKLDKSRVKDIEYVKKISEALANKEKNVNVQILDARSEGRFAGTDPEPRKGMRSGSIPGSLNNFFKNLYNPDKTFKSPEEIRKIYEKIGIDFNENVNVINSCGSGMTACINLLGLEVAGKMNTSLYDGSWLEWASVVN